MFSFWLALVIYLGGTGSGLGPEVNFDALDHRTNRHGAVALDKVLHLGQDHAQVAQLAGIDLACQNVGQLQGLVFLQPGSLS